MHFSSCEAADGPSPHIAVYHQHIDHSCVYQCSFQLVYVGKLNGPNNEPWGTPYSNRCFGGNWCHWCWQTDADCWSTISASLGHCQSHQNTSLAFSSLLYGPQYRRLCLGQAVYWGSFSYCPQHREYYHILLPVPSPPCNVLCMLPIEVHPDHWVGPFMVHIAWTWYFTTLSCKLLKIDTWLFMYQNTLIL